MKTSHLLALMAALVIAGVCIILTACSASAESEMRWVRRVRCDYTYGYCNRVLAWRRVYYRPRYYEPRRDYDGWERRDEHEEHGEDCKGDAIFVVGDLHDTENGALNAAVRQWQSQARYLHGERFMSLENARHYRYRCDRASTNETTVGKIAEGVGHIVGADIYQRRCALSAVPCRLGMERGDRDKR